MSKKSDSQKRKDLKQQEKKYKEELKRLKQSTEQQSSLQKKKLNDARAPKNAIDYIGYQKRYESIKERYKNDPERLFQVYRILEYLQIHFSEYR